MRTLIAYIVVLAGLALGGTAQADRWDSKGWVKLGEQTVNGRADHDRVMVGTHELFTKLTLKVENSDLELLDLEVTFANNDKYHPSVRQVFREGARTRVIDLPGKARYIKWINLRYRNLPGRGRAKVEVWGWRSGGSAAPTRPTTRWRFNSAGWTRLGQQTVQGRVDHDRIQVGPYRGKFRKLMIVVEDSDIELLDFDVTWKNGQHWNPRVTHYFREGQRSRAIDLPGRNDRPIRSIDLRYRNLPGGGRATVQVWGR